MLTPEPPHGPAAPQTRTIRIPVHLVEVINQLSRAQHRMRRDLGRQPTPAELAAELGLTPEKVIELQEYLREPEPPAWGEDPGPVPR